MGIEEEAPCKGCGQSTHAYYMRKYGGYCLDCFNCGVPERDEKIAELLEALRKIASRDHEPSGGDTWLESAEGIAQDIIARYGGK